MNLKVFFLLKIIFYIKSYYICKTKTRCIMNDLKNFDEVRLVVDPEYKGIITGIITRPGITTYLVSFGLDGEKEVYRKEIELV